MKRLSGLIVAGAILIVAGVLVVYLRFDPAISRERLTSGLAAVTGRAWETRGRVRFVPGLRPALVFRELRAPNVAWATQPDFIRIESLRFEFDWWRLLRAGPRPSRVLLDGVAVNLETDGDGANNWSLTAAARTATQAKPDIPADLEQIRVERGFVRFRSGWADAETSYPVGLLSFELHGDEEPLTLAFEATVRGQTLSGGGKLGTPAAMFGGEPFDIALAGRYSGRESNASIAVDGRVDQLAGLAGLDLRFTLKADSLNDLGSISGFELPRDTPVAITAVAVNEGDGPRLQDYVLRIGQAILRPQD